MEKLDETDIQILKTLQKNAWRRVGISLSMLPYLILRNWIRDFLCSVR